MPESGARIAILVDAENISADNWPMIGKSLLGLGRAISLTCFADFTNPALAGWLEICRVSGGSAVFALRTGRKNGSDIALTIAAMELLHSRAAEMFVIVSSDSDFAPLAHKITAAGCVAVGIGQATASEGLRRAFDRYYLLPPLTDALPKPANAPGPNKLTASQQQALVRLIARLGQEEETGAVLLSRLGVVLHRELPELAATIGVGRLRKVLKLYDLASESEAGTSVRVAPHPANPAERPSQFSRAK